MTRHESDNHLHVAMMIGLAQFNLMDNEITESWRQYLRQKLFCGATLLTMYNKQAASGQTKLAHWGKMHTCPCMSHIMTRIIQSKLVGTSWNNESICKCRHSFTHTQQSGQNALPPVSILHGTILASKQRWMARRSCRSNTDNHNWGSMLAACCPQDRNNKSSFFFWHHLRKHVHLLAMDPPEKECEHNKIRTPAKNPYSKTSFFVPSLLGRFLVTIDCKQCHGCSPCRFRGNGPHATHRCHAFHADILARQRSEAAGWVNSAWKESQISTSCWDSTPARNSANNQDRITKHPPWVRDWWIIDWWEYAWQRSITYQSKE